MTDTIEYKIIDFTLDEEKNAATFSAIVLNNPLCQDILFDFEDVYFSFEGDDNESIAINYVANIRTRSAEEVPDEKYEKLKEISSELIKKIAIFFSELPDPPEDTEVDED